MRWQLINWVLLFLVAFELWGLVTTLAVDRSAPEAVVSAGDARRAAEFPVLPDRRPDPTLVSAITAGDLFDPTRRAPDVAESALEVPPPSGLNLKGVVRVGRESEAILTEATTPAATGPRATAAVTQQLRVRVGEEVAGHRVTSITDEEVVLTSPAGEQVRLVMPIEASAGTPASPMSRRTVRPPPRAAVQRPEPASAVSRLGQPGAGAQVGAGGGVGQEDATMALEKLMEQLPPDVQRRLRQSRRRRARAVRERSE